MGFWGLQNQARGTDVGPKMLKMFDIIIEISIMICWRLLQKVNYESAISTWKNGRIMVALYFACIGDAVVSLFIQLDSVSIILVIFQYGIFFCFLCDQVRLKIIAMLNIKVDVLIQGMLVYYSVVWCNTA
jgi:hypothetical protein